MSNFIPCPLKDLEGILIKTPLLPALLKSVNSKPEKLISADEIFRYMKILRTKRISVRKYNYENKS